MPNVGYSGSVSILVLALLKKFTKSERNACVQQCTNNQHNPVQYILPPDFMDGPNNNHQQLAHTRSTLITNL